MRKVALSLILFCTFILGSSFSASAYLVDSSDNGLVPNVLQFEAIPGDKHVSLSWEKPESDNFSGVSILRSDQNYIPAYDENQSIYKGSDKSFIDLELTNDKTYFYTIFAYDTSGVYSSGSIAKATPKLPSLAEPYQRTPNDFLDTNQGKPLESTKKIDKIALADFYYYLVLNKKVLEVGLNDSGELHVAGGLTALIEIPSDIFSKPANVISVSTDESSYLMTLIPDKNKYQVVISTPKNSGDYQLRFVAVFKDSSVSDIKTKIVIEPKGTVYQKGSSYLGFGKRQEMRLEGAKVVVYFNDGGTWKIWDAEKYFQQNPQTTDSSGEYAFFVPKGEYYIKVSKAGFRSHKTDPFTMGPEILNKNIEIAPWIDSRICAVVILILVLLFGFWLKKRAKRK